MKLAIASGKGGTGKTSLSVALALSADRPVHYLDCDVEAPNGDLFLHAEPLRTEEVTVLVPEIDNTLCNGCGKCSELCQFGAIVSSKQQRTAWSFASQCHNCGGCALICPTGAIKEIPRPIGTLRAAQKDHILLTEGKLSIGEVMAPPIIKALKKQADSKQLIILDAPPGTSCPMINTVEDADFVILVTEPTPFGLHDLRLAVETVRKLCRPFGVVINRSGTGNDQVKTYCREQQIDLLLEIPHSLEVARCYSEGKPITDALKELPAQLKEMLNKIEQRIDEETPA